MKRALACGALGLAGVIAACSADGRHTDEPEASASASAVASASALPVVEKPCEDETACRELAARVLGDGDRPRAIALYDRGCQLQPYSSSCSELARAFMQTPPESPNKLLEVLRMACKSRDFNLVDACVAVAKIAVEPRWTNAERDSLIHEAGTYACLNWGHPDTNNWGATAATKDRAGLAELCNTFGQTPPIEEEGLKALGEACQLEQPMACARLKQIADLGRAAPLPNANLDANGLDVDGVAVDDLSCKLANKGKKPKPEDVVAAVRGRVAALEACGWGTMRVHLWQKGGKTGTVTKVEADEPDAKLKSCVEAALAGAPATIEAECLMTVDFSPPEAAEEGDTGETGETGGAAD
ncbi:MAG: hypothetical protein U0271_01685 [Polyangiaceae bacterium]